MPDKQPTVQDARQRGEDDGYGSDPDSRYRNDYKTNELRTAYENAYWHGRNMWRRDCAM